MTGPSSTPRGEHTPRPGTTWETRLVVVETVIPDDADDDAPTTTPDNGRRIGPGYCPHCGRGDCAPTAEEYRSVAEQRDQLAATLDRIRQMADAWEQRLPETIRTATAVEAIRHAVNGDTRPVMFEVNAQPAAPVDTEAEERPDAR